jgi:hypothetical protein
MSWSRGVTTDTGKWEERKRRVSKLELRPTNNDPALSVIGYLHGLLLALRVGLSVVLLNTDGHEQ